MRFTSVISIIVACAGAFIGSSMALAQAADTAKASLTSGEVIAVYPKEKRVLLKHGPIANLGMSEMTMEFGVANRRLLTSFKRGKKVRFSAIMVNDDYIVTHVEKPR